MPSEAQPMIIARSEKKLSPWVTLIEKGVCFTAEAKAETYHSIGLQDYIAIIARTPNGLIPIVRQFRPAVEAHTWELPAGLLEAGENPRDAGARELQEETGVKALSLVDLGRYYTDTGRIENRSHLFFAECTEQSPDFKPEPGMEVRFVSPDELRQMVKGGEFIHLIHLGAILAFQYLILGAP